MTNTICVVSANTATIVFGNDVVIVVRPKDAIAGAVDVGVGVDADADVNGVWVLFRISKQSKNRTNDRPTNRPTDIHTHQKSTTGTHSKAVPLGEPSKPLSASKQAKYVASTGRTRNATTLARTRFMHSWTMTLFSMSHDSE